MTTFRGPKFTLSCSEHIFHLTGISTLVIGPGFVWFEGCVASPLDIVLRSLRPSPQTTQVHSMTGDAQTHPNLLEVRIG